MILIISSLFIISLIYFFQTALACSYCAPSACGNIRNISYPFRLKDDPPNCGDADYELSCENNVTSIYLYSQKYFVKAIDFIADDDNTIRLVDASISNDDICSFPNSSTYAYNFSYHPGAYFNYDTQTYSNYSFTDVAWPVNFMSCPTPLKNSSLFTDITHDCASISSQSHPRFTYIKIDHMNASDVPESCGLEMIVMTSWKFNDFNNVSLSEIHRSLLYGFKLNFQSFCFEDTTTTMERFKNFFGARLLSPIMILVVIIVLSGVNPVMAIIGITVVFGLLLAIVIHLYYVKQDYSGFDQLYSYTGFIPTIMTICVPRFIICPIAVWLLIYKFRRRHLSVFDTIECFLQGDNKLTPIRYSYSEIKKITRGFQDKLGEGGYGSVYKGKLRSGHDVAVKLLGKSRANGQDFINEIATIGRIHHVNIVKLVGYCAEGSKRALVLDFLPHGSLEKYLFGREKMMNSLDWDTKFEISVGVARGIEYLHQGCDVQILHFDIKPHNILLDDNFIPKISDFGLAKFCSIDKNTMTMTTARGTIGYVAPELISRSIGAVSYKADVYSFGMLLMEMVGLKKDLVGNNGDSSQYFPNWIYDCFNKGREIQIEKAANKNDDKDENDSTRKLIRKMTIVALWCIQMSPNDRPSMNKVLKMLEDDVERLQIPDYPNHTSAQIEVNVDQTETACSTCSLPLLRHDDLSSCVEITIEE